MRRAFRELVLALGLVCLARAAAAGALDGVPRPTPEIRYRRDAVIVRLGAGATARAVDRFRSLAGAQGARAGVPPGPEGVPRTAPVASARADPPATLSASAAELGIRLEPEFPSTWADLRVRTSASSPLAGYWIAHLPPGLDAREAILRLRASADVDTAFPIALAPVTVVPNDSLWRTCDHLFQPSRHDVHAPEAWDLSRGDTSVVVGIMDTGVLLSHPDLAGTTPGQPGNLWVNRAELAGAPGVDDDGNGYVDDVQGWDFVSFNDGSLGSPGEDVRDEDPDPNDFVGHGTGVAGVVGAITDNGHGVPGLAWTVRLMPLRVGWSSPQRPSGEIDLSSVARVVDYAARMRVSVVNGSFASVYQPDLADAMSSAIESGTVIVVAGGNYGSPHDMADDPDVIGVAAVDSADQVTGFSNVGDYIDLSAPGLFVTTTALFKDFSFTYDSIRVRQPGYSTTASGTSFSAPVVTGAVALLQAYRHGHGLPALSPVEVQDRLVDTADDIDAQNPGRSGYGTGRVNVFRLLSEPPASWRARLTARSVGAIAVFPSAAGGSRVATALADGSLVLIDGDGGRILWSGPLGGVPAGGVAVSALPDDGLGMFVATTDGRLHGVDLAGRPLPGWPVATTGLVGGGWVTPAVADVDGDARPDVVAGGVDGRVWAWSADAHPIPGFPVRVGTPPADLPQPVSIALSDLDSIPGREIVAVMRVGYVNATMSMVAPRSAQVMWSVGLGLPALPPLVMNLGHTHQAAVVVAANRFVYAYSPGGVLLWRRDLPDKVCGAPAVGDLNGDGADEIAVANNRFDVAVIDSAGELAGSFTLDSEADSDGPYPSPVIGPSRPGSSGLAWTVEDRLGVHACDGPPPPGFPRIASGWGSLAYGPTLAGNRASLIAATNRGRPELRCVALPPGTAGGASPTWATERGDPGRTGSRRDPASIALADDVPPARIVDLDVHGIETHAVRVRWTAPSDPVGHVTRYELRTSDHPLDAASFATARLVATATPSAPGSVDSARIADLPEQRAIFASIRSVDEAGNASPISNVATAVTASIAPSVIADLRVAQAGTSALRLEWTATGDDGRQGEAARYDVRASTRPLDAAGFDSVSRAQVVNATAPPGARERVELAGLERGARYWVALVAVDAAGNRSPLSNVITAQAGPLAAAAGIALSTAVQPSRAPVELYWQLDASEPAELSVFDVIGRRRRSLALALGHEGVTRWDGLDDRGERLGPGIYFARLTCGARHVVGRIVLVE